MKRISSIVGPAVVAASFAAVAACAVTNTAPPAAPTTAAATPTTPETPATPATPATTPPAASTPAAPSTPAASSTPAPAASAAAEPQPPHQEIAPPPEKPHEYKLTVADGRPAGLHPGVVESYWIWHDDHGKWWHVRTSTHSQLHRFQGWVWHDKDRFTDIHPTRMEWNDRIKYGAAGASFDFSTKGHEDGFDFRTNGAQCVRFGLWIDGKPAHTNLVHIGAGAVHPPGNHFKLCP